MPRTQVRCRGGRALSPPPNLPSHLCKSLYLNSTKMYISVRVSIVSDAAALVPSYLPSLKPKSQSSLGLRLLPSQPSVACRAGWDPATGISSSQLCAWLWYHVSESFLSTLFSVSSLYSKLLLQSQKPHIRQFAVESFGFLLRKVHDCDCMWGHVRSCEVTDTLLMSIIFAVYDVMW